MKFHKPNDNMPLRFVTSQSISQDVVKHGIAGYFQNGRFWSADGADHWTPHEVTWWQYTASGVMEDRHQTFRADTPEERK